MYLRDLHAYVSDFDAAYSATKQSPRRPESLPTTLALQLQGRGLSRTSNMHAMTRKRLRRSAERATELMKTNDGCVRTHSAKQKRIGSGKNRTLHPESMHGSPNQEAKLLSSTGSELDSDERRERINGTAVMSSMYFDHSSCMTYCEGDLFCQ